MDTLWIFILDSLMFFQKMLNELFSPINSLSPALSIAIIALIAFLIAHFSTRKYKTKRYKDLKQEFEYWFAIKKEALEMRESEPEKAKQVAKSIDQEKLNKVYYEFFIEGLLNNLLTLHMPILFLLLYVNYTYTPEFLQKTFGSSSLFQLVLFNEQTISIGASAWFFFVLITIFCIWQLGKSHFIRKKAARFLGNLDHKNKKRRTLTVDHNN